jgi:hypothetical protein
VNIHTLSCVFPIFAKGLFHSTLNCANAPRVASSTHFIFSLARQALLKVCDRANPLIQGKEDHEATIAALMFYMGKVLTEVCFRALSAALPGGRERVEERAFTMIE